MVKLAVDDLLSIVMCCRTVGVDAKITGGAVEGGCPRCGKRVYEAEKKIAVGQVSISDHWHNGHWHNDH